MDMLRKQDLEKQGYRLVGSHSAIKVCTWCKKSMRDEGVCYKQKFYGIESHRCLQMTPALKTCTLRCQWCWRDISWTENEWRGPVDDPKDIVDGCIQAHIEYLQGFGGNKKTNKDKFAEIMPKHFAISLSGEPTMYPKLGELIKEVNDRGITTFVVTNGTFPDRLAALSALPTQLYLTLPASNKKTFENVCKPTIDGAWDRIMESASELSTLKTRKVCRLTLTKGLNMHDPEGWAKLISGIDADYFELKSYMWVGYSQLRLTIDNMARHPEIREFAEKVAKQANMKIIDEHQISRVVLLARDDKADRILASL